MLFGWFYMLWLVGRWDNGTAAALDLSTAAAHKIRSYLCFTIMLHFQKVINNEISTSLFQIGEVKVPLCMVDLAQTIEEWKDIQSVKVDDQVGGRKMLIKHDIDSE